MNMAFIKVKYLESLLTVLFVRLLYFYLIMITIITFILSYIYTNTQKKIYIYLFDYLRVIVIIKILTMKLQTMVKRISI